jgi:acetoin utilization protein AcuB
MTSITPNLRWAVRSCETFGMALPSTPLAPELCVADVMTPDPVAIDASAHLSDAVTLMEAHGVRHLPVVRGGILAGLLSERHLRDAMPSVLTLSDPVARKRFLSATRVTQVWIESPKTISPQAPVAVAIHAMRNLRAGSLPVTDGKSRLVGIITSGDLLNLLERLLSARART